MTSFFNGSAILLITAALATAGCNMNTQNGVRAGHGSAKPSETLVKGEVNRWIRTVGEADEETPSVSNVTSTAVRTGTYNDFHELVELVYPPDERQQVKRNLENAGYFDVAITENGVTYDTQTYADQDLRSIMERHYPTREFTPHDCTRVIGDCAFTVGGGGRPELHYIRTSSLRRGIWTDKVAYDPARDPAGRSDVVEERRFSVTGTGMIKDMEQKYFLQDGVYLVTLRHIERIVPTEEPKVAIARPELAPGNDGDVGLGCTDGTVHALIGDERIEVRPGGIVALPVRADTEVGFTCTTSNGEISVGTRCFSDGHIRALFVDGWAALGCYEGTAPAQSWTEG